jgi:hypothetical protein
LTHIPTTATAVQKLKRLAKTRRKSSSESLAGAQDAIAREHGYRDWKHVTVCLAATAAEKCSPDALPHAVRDFLSEQQKVQPASAATAQAMATGLVFAMDIKDADNVRPESNPEIHECEDATAFLAGDVWRAVLRREREEGQGEDETSLEPDEEVQQLLDDIGNYRFFRFSGLAVPKNLDDAFAGPFRDFFFPPTHVWLEGKFFDMADVREVRVEGRVVYATSPGSSNSSPAAVYSASAAAPPSAPNSRPKPEFIVARLDVRKLQASLYEYVVSYSGQEMFSDAGFSSIADALREAADVTGSIRGYEVAFAGLVAGTYAVEELASTADQVAQRAVEIAASLGRF